MKRALLVVPMVFAALLVLPTAPAWACSCAAVTPAQAVDRADVVVQATLQAVDAPRGFTEPTTGAPARSYRFTVARVYEGSAPVTARVGSAKDGASCGMEGLVPGREYVVFAHQRGDTLWADLCGGTAPAATALVADVEAVTGPGRPPAAAVAVVPNGRTPSTQPPGAVAPVSERAWLVPLLGGVALALVLAAALLVVVRRGRRTA